jgi:hypothetical protein
MNQPQNAKLNTQMVQQRQRDQIGSQNSIRVSYFQAIRNSKSAIRESRESEYGGQYNSALSALVNLNHSVDSRLSPLNLANQ